MTRRATAAHGALLRRVRLGVLRRWFGMPLLVLETTGRRTGERRAATLAYLPDGDDFVVVAANAGAARAPAWWLNLRAAGAGRRRPRDPPRARRRGRGAWRRARAPVAADRRRRPARPLPAPHGPPAPRRGPATGLTPLRDLSSPARRTVTISPGRHLPMRRLRTISSRRLRALAGAVAALAISGGIAQAALAGDPAAPPPKPLDQALHDAADAPASPASAPASRSPTR